MASFNILSTILVASINFITIPIFTRMLDTDGFGVVSLYVAWVQIVTVFVGLRADGSIGSAHANLRDDEQDSYQVSILVMGFFSFVVILSLTLAFLPQLESALGMSRLLVFAMVFQSFGAFVVALFSMRFIFKRQPQYNLAMSVGITLVTTLCSVLLIWSGAFGADGYLGRVLGLAAPYFTLGLVLFALLLAKRAGVKFTYWKFCLALTIPLIFHGLSQLVLAQTGKIALQRFDGNETVGIYAIAVTVVGLLAAIYTALNNAFVPFMYEDLAGKTSAFKKLSHFKNYFSMFTLGSCAFVLVAAEVLKVLSTEPFWGAVKLLPVLVFGQYCVFLYSFPVNFEFFKMRTASIAVGTSMAAGLNVVLCLVLIPKFGMEGAAASTAIAYFALFVFHFSIARFLLGDRNYPVKAYIGGLALVGAVCAFSYLMMDQPLVRWVVGVCVFLAIMFRIVKTRSIF